MEQKTNSGYITIAEYAKRRGVSVAAVYKRLDGTLKEYVKEIDGKKFLSVDVLAAEGITPVEKGYKPGLNTQDAQDAGKPGETEEAPADAAGTNTAFVIALEALEKQLAEKDQQIARLQEEAAEMRKEAAAKDQFIRDQSSRLSLLLEQSQELQRNNQILLGLAQGKGEAPADAQEVPPAEVQEEEAPARSVPQNVPADAQDAAAPVEQPASQEEAPAEETAGTEERRGFWWRLFGGKKK